MLPVSTNSAVACRPGMIVVRYDAWDNSSSARRLSLSSEDCLVACQAGEQGACSVRRLWFGPARTIRAEVALRIEFLGGGVDRATLGSCRGGRRRLCRLARRACPG